jgi:ketosteroid isomerase-like protein
MTSVEQTVDAAALQDVIDESRIRALHADYVDAVNRRAWDEFEDLFLPDAQLTVVKGPSASDEVTGPAAIGGLIAGYVSGYEFLIQVVLNARIRVRHEGDADRAFARLYISEFRQVTSSGRAIESAGVYHDTYQRGDGRWRFARRRYDRIYHTAARDLEVHPYPADLPFADGFARRG